MNKQFFLKLNRMVETLGSWEKVAKAIGVNSRSIRKWWNGERTPSPMYQRKVLGYR